MNATGQVTADSTKLVQTENNFVYLISIGIPQIPNFM